MASKTAPSPIQELEAQLQALDSKITAKQCELDDFGEAIALVQDKPRWIPSPGELSAFDRLNAILEAKPEQAQAEALAAARESLRIGKGELEALEVAANGLRRKLAEERGLAALVPLAEAMNAAGEAYLAAQAAFFDEIPLHPAIKQMRSDPVRLEWIRKPSTAYGAPSFERMHYHEKPEQAI
jgi:prefoldin subunit 5